MDAKELQVPSLKLYTCSTCRRTIKHQPDNREGQCPECEHICFMVPAGWENRDTTIRMQRPVSIHPKEWVLNPLNKYIQILPDKEDDSFTGCWNWLPGAHHAPQASPSLFESPLAPEMHWAVKSRAGRQVPAYYLFMDAPDPKLLQPEADHLCCNRRCVNPDHIEWTSKAENTRRNTIRDKYARIREKLVAEAEHTPKSGELLWEGY